MSSGWDAFLGDGEHVIWQGRPRGHIIWRDLLTPLGFFGLFFLAFSLFWMGASWSLLSDNATPLIFRIFPLFGLPFVLVGLYMVAGHVVADAYMRQHTHYSLTTRQAFIARNMFGRRSLQSWPLHQIRDVTLDYGPPGSIHFAIGSGPDRRAFRQIDGADRVYRQFLDAKRAAEEAFG